MKSKIITSIMLILTILLSMFTFGCSATEEPYNLIVTNNCGEGLENIGYYENNSSGGILNADNSLIKDGEDIAMYIDTNPFILSVTDENGKEFKSQEFDLDFGEGKVFSISVEFSSSGEMEFILEK